MGPSQLEEPGSNLVKESLCQPPARSYSTRPKESCNRTTERALGVDHWVQDLGRTQTSVGTPLPPCRRKRPQYVGGRETPSCCLGIPTVAGETEAGGRKHGGMRGKMETGMRCRQEGSVIRTEPTPMSHKPHRSVCREVDFKTKSSPSPEGLSARVAEEKTVVVLNTPQTRM